MDDIVCEIVVEFIKYIELCHFFNIMEFKESHNKKSILVFMPGIVEINILRDMLLSLSRVEPPKEHMIEQFFFK